MYESRVREGTMSERDIPFYAIYDVGTYTFAPFKVVWAEMANTLRAAVISHAGVPFGGGGKVIVPDHKVYFAAFQEPDYAHYVCALLNSEPVRMFIDGFTIKIQVGSLFRHVTLPAYNPELLEHQSLIARSKEAHAILASTSGKGDISEQQSAIDRLAWTIITDAGSGISRSRDLWTE